MRARLRAGLVHRAAAAGSALLAIACQPEPEPPAPRPAEYQDRSSRCFGMRCCAPGYGVSGVLRDGDQLACRALPPGPQDCFVDHPTARAGLRACPEGTYVRGLDRARNLLTCCFDQHRGATPLAREVVVEPEPAAALASCSAAGNADAVVLGLDHGPNRLLCGTIDAGAYRRGGPARPARPQAGDGAARAPAIDPEAPRGFLSLAGSMTHQAWRRLARNWLARLHDLPVAEARPRPPTIQLVDVRTVEGGVRRHKLRYAASVEGQQIPAYLLFPPGYDERRSYPAALLLHGHFADGKEDFASLWDGPAHALALLLAQHGFVTLAPDTRGWGEFRVAGAPGHDAYVQQLRAAAGGNLGALPALVLRDNLVNLSVLASTPGVRSIAAGGLSLGGVQAMWLAAMDDRVSSVFLAGSFAGFACQNDPELAHECQTIPGLSSGGPQPAAGLLLDAADLAALIAPRPLMITWGSEDHLLGLTPRRGVQPCSEAAIEGARLVYRAVHAPAALQVEVVPWARHEIDPAGVLTFLTGQRPAQVLDWGTACNGMHCCPPGAAVAGVHPARDLLVCLRTDEAAPRSDGCFTVTGAVAGAGAGGGQPRLCPAGSYLRGLDRRQRCLTCCPRASSRAAAAPSATPVEAAGLAFGIRACPAGAPLAAGLSAQGVLLCTPD
jgi:hypothetical protein